jgi:predicted PurR-regulated permease PerM
MRGPARETIDKLKGADSSLVTGILVLAVLYFARDVFVPFALAGLLAFLLAPLATRLERWKFRKTPAALLVILLCVVGLGSLGWAVLGQVYGLAVELPQYQQNVTDKVGALHLNSAGKLSSTVEMLTNVSKQIASGGTVSPVPVLPIAPRQKASNRTLSAIPALKSNVPVTVRIEEPDESVMTMAGRTIVPLIHPLTTIFIVVIFLIFMLLGREDLRDRGLRLAGKGRMHVTTTAIEDASHRVSRYLQMQLVVNLLYGIVVCGSLWLIGVPKPFLWGVLTCVLRFVPYIGILIAATGPLLVSIAVSAHWSELIWTVLLFVVLELITGNFVEPLLYGASTGMSALAILIAAIFWTVLWGLPGLLLSTPLTVCLVVMGRQVPQLQFLDVLFGEERIPPPAERFYQRILSSNNHEAKAFLEQILSNKSRAEVYDSVIIPALTMVEEARYAEEITAIRAEEMLQEIEEISERIHDKGQTLASPSRITDKTVVCIPARDLADEVACQLALQVISDTASATVVSADYNTSDVQQTLAEVKSNVVCVIGVPPRAVRHLRMRCHQIRLRFPEAIVVACVLNSEDVLSSLRSRIPTEDAQHVVSSLQMLNEYLVSLLYPSDAEIERESEGQGETDSGLGETFREMERIDLFDGPEEGIFSRLAADLARAFEAPIALITVMDGQRKFWEAQCGLPAATLSSMDSDRDLSICSRASFFESSLVIPDVEEDDRFSKDCFLKDHGIRFYAGAPLKTHDDNIIGSLCVLDTRPRQLTEHQKKTLVFIANAVMTAIELHTDVLPDDAESSASS